MNELAMYSTGDETGLALGDRDVVEVPLLLPGWQVAALAEEARDRGLTAGEMLRSVLSDFIDGLEQQRSSTIR